MSKKELTTDPYKGVRDFYPEDKAIQNYIFDTWHTTARQFGFEEYDASILEPSELYKSKGVQNEEMVNEQTYTFKDRSDREVTLRPEMTPTVARMVAGRAKELYFPLRWYSIPNLFRYERTQRGRLREHWQLNCDIFGTDDITAEIEMVLLANQIFLNFGAENGTHFEICVNHRGLLDALYKDLELSEETATAVTRLADKMQKMEVNEFEAAVKETAARAADTILKFLRAKSITEVPEFLKENSTYLELEKFIDDMENKFACPVKFDPSVIRGFDYYTGIVFEIFDLHPENKRAMLGGGRYENLTTLFGGDKLPGIGFGMGDVTMRDFLESHNLLTANITAPTLIVIPTDTELNIDAEVVANTFRQAGISAAVDIGERKMAKKLAAADKQMVEYAIIIGDDEVKSQTYVLKNMTEGSEECGTLEELISKIV
tara:strand:- start:879 stop:2171 length:1293 start_codon:yes stop_codon:yes gene_type:complete